MTRALVVVDVQRDFCEGGSLAVSGGAELARKITSFVRDNQNVYDVLVKTRDYHEDPGTHFSDQPDFLDSWPQHCVVSTPGAQFHPDLVLPVGTKVFSKGLHAAAYSGFEGTDDSGQDLGSFLRSRGVSRVDVVGIATDYCVKATAIDAVERDFETRVLLDLTAGVSQETTDDAIASMTAVGVTVTTTPTRV